MRVLVCGGRNLNEYGFTDRMVSDRLDEWVSIHGEPDVIIQGEAYGFDAAAKRWAEKNDIETEDYPADWDTHGKRAGYLRNIQMLQEGKPDLVIAFPGGRGTTMMRELAMKDGIEIHIEEA